VKKYIVILTVVIACSFQISEAGILDIFNPPSEFSLVSASRHFDKGEHRYNEVHWGLGLAGNIRGNKNIFWEGGFVFKDSYGCSMWYAGSSWFPDVLGTRDKTFRFGGMLFATKKCLHFNEGARVSAVVLPTIRLCPTKDLCAVIIGAPKIKDDMTGFLVVQLRFGL